MNSDAALTAALFAVDPAGLSGTVLRARAGEARDEWLALLRRLLPENTPWRRVPLNIQDSALLGGLDLGATLQAGRPVAQQGVLALADGGVLLLPMAERLSIGTAARLSAVLDQQEVVVQRDGLALRQAARVGMVALDEGADDTERLPSSLLDRLAFHLILQNDSQAPQETVQWRASDIENARASLGRVTYDDACLHALCTAAQALGVDSLRAPWLALRTARAAAALAGAAHVDDEHIALAARLVLAPRATRIPAAPEAQEPPAQESPAPAQEQPPEPQPEKDSPAVPEAPNEPSSQDGRDQASKPNDTDEAAQAPPPQPLPELAETVLAAAQAAIPAGLLALLKLGAAGRVRGSAVGRSGAVRQSQSRGRPVGARRGEPRAGARLNVMETLRAAAPWQRVRDMQQRAAASGETGHASQADTLPTRRIQVRREDFHVSRYKQKTQTTTVFLVDASGSSALNRLAEAKGAVELLLADCYVRRDQVAVLAFRGKDAQLLLPPTRSLARAKRSLAGLPGGGGTPLASALDAACALGDQIRRRGETPLLVLLTDGRANIARNGAPGRAQATADALTAARDLRLAGFSALLIDTAPQPQASAQQLATAMGGRYLPLPQAGAAALSQAVRAMTLGGSKSR